MSQRDSERFSDVVVRTCTLLEKSTQKPDIYKIPLKEGGNKIDGCKFLSFGKRNKAGPRHTNHTILVLGATGAGKSALINGMINYILGVKWEDPYRFKIVDDGEKKSQAHSQTSLVTVYKLHYREGFNIDYTLTIVDTPGFGDTRGIDRDREITVQLRNLFSSKDGINVIDAVCFVAQAALARLTATQKYIFDSIFSIFGKDIKENIRVLVTFADNQKPPVLEAISVSGVPCPKNKKGVPVYYKFNNSALFADNGDSDNGENFDQMFWKMGTENMKKFFAELSRMEPKSLMLTNQVLEDRQELEISIENLGTKVKLGLAKLEEITKTEQEIQKHRDEIMRNQNFSFIINKTVPEKVKISGSKKYTTNCQKCQYTCHFPCKIQKTGDKRRCGAINKKNGKCRNCKGKCTWNVHVSQNFRWTYKTVTETQTMQDLKERYEAASQQKMTFDGLMSAQKAEYEAIENDVQHLIEKATKCVNRLSDIALEPNHLSTPDYIELLIQAEKFEQKNGWGQRVWSLEKMKAKATLMAKVRKGENPLHNQPK
uniref:AIG1-type G domain-containing protein n=1 Tax=Cyprinodon variegatus TaxID=28743 RepID=A0A3Q2CUC6_CYPVA